MPCLKTESNAVADIQNLPDKRRVPIKRVGIKRIKHPIDFLSLDGSLQSCLAEFDLAVSLEHAVKGTHMSRFVELLNEHVGPFSLATPEAWLKRLRVRLQAVEAEVKVQFPYWRRKLSPISQRASVLDYKVEIKAELNAESFKQNLSLDVPVTTLCPCSKAISAYGAHNQRSVVTVKLECLQEVHLSDLIKLIEAESSCELYGLLKRSDEKYITERAYENPKFVEDLVRDIALRLRDHPSVGAFTVEAENIESIHNHSAYAFVASQDLADSAFED